MLRAHRIFLLHHSASLFDIFLRVGKPNLCKVLQRFWDAFVAKWDVLLHGNPAAEIFNALHLSAGGELGIGVGEEEWGSGEREVLEDFIGRTTGLIDIVVSRFGAGEHADLQSGGKRLEVKAKGRLQGSSACLKYPEPSNGVVFSGIRAVSRKSVRDISIWMETLYTDGEEGYGVYDNPSSTRLRKRRKVRPQSNDKSQRPPVDIPPSLFSPRPLNPVQPGPEQRNSTEGKAFTGNGGADTENEPSFDTATMMKYLTLGAYGSKWSTSLWKQNSSQDGNSIPSQGTKVPKNERGFAHTSRSAQEPSHLPSAYYLIGLRGEVESDDELDNAESGQEERQSVKAPPQRDEWIRSRTILVERSNATGSERSLDNDEKTHERVRVVVYVVIVSLSPPYVICLFFLAITLHVYVSFRAKHRLAINTLILQGYSLPARAFAALTLDIDLAQSCKRTHLGNIINQDHEQYCR